MTLSGSGKRYFDYATHVKAPHDFVEFQSSAIDIREKGETSGLLVPLTFADMDNPESIKLLCDWRNQTGDTAFVDHRETTLSQTQAWLQQRVLGDSNRLLFWITDKFGMRKIGHAGLVFHEGFPDFIEIDNVVRGEEVSPGLMKSALETLEKFSERRFGFNHLFLRVKRENQRAIAFYEKLGFNFVSQETFELLPNHSNQLFFMQKKVGWEFETPILTAGPHLDENDTARVTKALRYEWNASHSFSINSFEKQIAQKTGRKYAIATSSCTGAMHLSLLACGIGPGDEVIVPEITWVATASVVRYLGATPVFVDVDPATWVVTKNFIEKAITPRTKAIMPVHLYGVSPNMDEIMQVARENNLMVVEDAAPAIGSFVSGAPAGSHGNIACFSFQGAKIAVSGEGGALVTDDIELYKTARQYNEHGRRPGSFEIEVLGYKYKPSNLSCALALGQLDKSDYLAQRKRRINSWYRQHLGGIPIISFQESVPNSEPNFWMTSIFLSGGQNVKDLAKHLSSHGVDTRPIFPPLSSFPLWSGDNRNANAQRIYSNSLNLPSGSHMTEEMVILVSEHIINFLQDAR